MNELEQAAFDYRWAVAEYEQTHAAAVKAEAEWLAASAVAQRAHKAMTEAERKLCDCAKRSKHEGP
jgi:hypothetical protein